MDEAETRRHLIDTSLRLAGWNLQDPSQVVEELDIDLAQAGEAVKEPTPERPYAGHQFTDYALKLRGRPELVVEAKRTSKDARLGQEQALIYAQNLQRIHRGPLPLITFTNGFDTWFWDSEFYPPQKVHGFPSLDDLMWLTERREARRPLSVELINTSIAGRDYQIEGIRTLLEAMEAKRQKFLMVMATGTGKTRTAVALVDLLMRARWAKRVLFLVDRIALRDQALDAFKEFLPSEPRWPNPDESAWAADRRVYVTTYPTMLNLIQAGTAPDTWISPFHFDLIIADESHRSIYNVYKQVVEYFHGLKLGLTATPKDHVEHDTFQFFDCPPNDPTFAYSFEEAITHAPPYLCDFEVLKVRSKFQLEGIHGPTLPAGQQDQLVMEGMDPEEIVFEGTDLERKVTNAATNALIVREFMEESIKDPSGVLPGKTIIFAISKNHAYRLQEHFDLMYPEHRGKLARVLVSEDRFVHGKGGLLDQFKTQDMPRVAISVDMLDTGVDIPEVVNLVFAKPVYSYVKFWQMIGRGTRILPEHRRPWCEEKDRFLIIDCWGNFEYFQMEPEGREVGQQVPVPVRLFRSRLELLSAGLDADRGDIVSAVVADLRADIASLPASNVVVREAAADLSRVQSDSFWARVGGAELRFLSSQIAPVLRAQSGADFQALRFETLTVQMATAQLLNREREATALRGEIQAQVAELPLTLGQVAREEPLIREVLGQPWWSEDLSPEFFGRLRQMTGRMGPLIRLRQPRPEGIVKLNLQDLTLIREFIEVGPRREQVQSAVYRHRIEARIRELVAQNPVLQKIQRGEMVSEQETEALAELLRAEEPWVTEESLRKVYDNRGARFLSFIRHILELEDLPTFSGRVADEFDRFIAEHTDYSATQLRLLQTLRTFVLQSGRVERRHLVEPPFTQLHPKGIRGVFTEHQISEILELAERCVA